MHHISIENLNLAKALLIQRPSKFENLQIGDHNFKDLFRESVIQALEGQDSNYNILIQFLNEAIAKNNEVYDYLDYYLQGHPLNPFGISRMQGRLHQASSSAFFSDITVKAQNVSDSDNKESQQHEALMRIAIGFGIITEEKELPLTYQKQEKFIAALKKADEIREIIKDPTQFLLQLESTIEYLYNDAEDTSEELPVPDADLVLYALNTDIANTLSIKPTSDGLVEILEEWMEQIVFFYPDNKKIAASILRWAFPSLQYLSDKLKNNLELLQLVAEEGLNNVCADYSDYPIFEFIDEDTEEFLRNNREFARTVFLSDIFICQMRAFSDSIKFDEETIDKRLSNLSDYDSFYSTPSEFEHILRHTPYDLLYSAELREKLYNLFEDQKVVDNGFNYYFTNADDNDFDDEYGNSALMLAVQYNNLALFQFLLKQEHIDLDQQNQDGNTVLHSILQGKNEQVFAIFLQQAQFSQEQFKKANNAGITPIDLMVKDADMKNICLSHLRKRKSADLDDASTPPSKSLKF